VGITFINKENPENRTQMTNWMMISKKVKKFNKILFQALTHFLPLFLPLLVPSTHAVSNIYISELIYTPAEKNMTTVGLITIRWPSTNTNDAMPVVQDSEDLMVDEFNINFKYSRVTFIGDGVRQYLAAAREEQGV